MAEYLPASPAQKQKHHFLAQRQGTRKAILPVHTTAEHDFFRKLMTESAVFNPPDGGQPQWTIGVKIWNAHADTQDEISYKVSASYVSWIYKSDLTTPQLIEQLKVYHAQWQKKLQIKEALSLTSGIRKPLALYIHDPSRSENAPPIPHHMPTPQTAKKGFINVDDTANMLPGVQITTTTPNHPDTPHTREELSHQATMTSSESMPPAVAEPAEPMASTSELQPYPPPQSLTTLPTAATNQPTPSSNNNRMLVEMLSRKRVADSILQRQPVTKKARKARTCGKCAVPGCPGRKAVQNCRNPCQDCKRVDCKGRNTKRLSRPCWYVPG